MTQHLDGLFCIVTSDRLKCLNIIVFIPLKLFDLYKECRPCREATFHDITSGFSLFIYRPLIYKVFKS